MTRKKIDVSKKLYGMNTGKIAKANQRIDTLMQQLHAMERQPGWGTPAADQRGLRIQAQISAQQRIIGRETYKTVTAGRKYHRNGR